jgi:cation-transporting P-type ATPase E
MIELTAGLTEQQARERLETRGEPPASPTSRSYASIVRGNTLTLFNLILASFLVVIVAAGRPADGLFGFILVANSGIGIAQEARAKRALDRAALLVAPRARVVRDGQTREVPVDEVLDGDVVALSPGDQVAADGTVLESVGLMLDESPLTGESVPVARGGGEPLLSGTFAVEGAGRYVAERTGSESYALRLTGVAREHRRQRSPLELEIDRLLKVLVGVMIPLGTAFIAVLVHRDVPYREAAGTATAGIVTLVPEGLILLASLTFAAAAVRLTRRGMLVQYLNSVESLANVDTVCLDKTGTLTDGSLALHSIDPVAGQDEASVRELLAGYAHSAAARNATIDALAAAVEGDPWEPSAEVPFSSRWKWSALRREPDGEWLVLGAPDVLCPSRLPGSAAHEAAGRRVLAFCRAQRVTEPQAAGDQPPAVTPLATVVFEERLREDARETIEFLHQQGVAVKVLSGDSAATVAAIAERAGVAGAGTAVEGADLPSDPAALAAAVRAGSVFARLTPDHKQAMVKALTADGAYVAMIGDGVNDVPAMKSARLAIALGSGSQLPKSVADGVLITDRFGAIPDAVGEGRQIIANVQRVAKLFVTKSVFAAVVIATYGLIAAAFPLLPRHLSLAGAFTVGVPGFVLALAHDSAPLSRERFLRRVARFAIPAGTVLAAAVIAAYLTVTVFHSYSASEGRTAAVLVFTAVGIYLVLVLDADRMQRSPQHAAFVVTLAALLAGAFLAVFGWPAARRFFDLSTPGWWQAIVVVAVFLAAIRVLSWFGLSPYRPL